MSSFRCVVKCFQISKKILLRPAPMNTLLWKQINPSLSNTAFMQYCDKPKESIVDIDMETMIMEDNELAIQLGRDYYEAENEGDEEDDVLWAGDEKSPEDGETMETIDGEKKTEYPPTPENLSGTHQLKDKENQEKFDDNDAEVCKLSKRVD